MFSFQLPDYDRPALLFGYLPFFLKFFLSKPMMSTVATFKLTISATAVLLCLAE